VSSVEALRNRGLLDVDYNHALFPALNALSGLVHGTGYVALSSNSGFAYVNVPTAAARDYVAQTLQKLGLTQRLPRRAGAAGAVENAERADKAASEAAKTPSPSAKIPAAKNSAAPKHYSVEEVTRADGSKSWQFKIFDAVLARALVAMGVPASAREKRSSRRAAVLPHVADLASSYGENEAALEHVRTNLAGLLAGGRIVRGPGSKRLLRFQLPLVFVKSVSPRVRSRVRRFHEPLRLLLQESFGVPFNLTVGNASASRGEGRKRLAPVFEVSARNFDEFKRRFPQYARLARGAE
jgi:hypothetical protein